MSTKLPPHSKEAELSVLGSMIAESSCIPVVKSIIDSSMLYNTSSKKIFELICDMYDDDIAIDLVSVCSALTPSMKESGITSYFISGLTTDAISFNHEYHSNIIRDKYLLRNIIDKSRRIANASYDSMKDAMNMLTDTHQEIGFLMNKHSFKSESIETLVDKTVDNIANSKNNLISTGFLCIDNLCGGMTKGEITIIGGRPSHGKTTLVVNMVKACVDQGLKVMVFNREMTNVEMIKKLLILESGKLSYLKIRRGMIGDLNESTELNKTMDSIKSKYNKDVFQMFDNIQTLEKASVEIQKFKPDIIFDDFIQLIRPKNPSKDRRFQIEEIVHTYKWLSKSVNAVAVLVSQLNRGVEYRTGADAKPKMSDLAESGSIEQSAENVIFVYYPYKVSLNEDKDSKNKLELIGSKVRYGVSGTSDVGFDGDKVKIYQSEDHYRKAGYGK
ncbi:hypothetical protein CMI37_15090 [Candidatus Pacearchaeota archaeon]|nr:hypothetical protein [Candidatus Pacearchaeota archaeon]|tara:strand:- start:185 stop:1516 length:1332 start_codon:yes stop_codon:yes gene_type:complete